MNRIYRIFISSCKRLLEKERRILSDCILDAGHLPVQMESNFFGSNMTYSIDIDKKKIEDSDCVIFILSYLYGEQIGMKINNCTKCPFYSNRANISNCSNCHRSGDNECQLSFTQFEYEYAKHKNKPIIVIHNTRYNDDTAFDADNKKYIADNNDNCSSAYFRFQIENKQFVGAAIIKHSFPYTTESEFINKCSSALSLAKDLISTQEHDGVTDSGLIPYSFFHEAESTAKDLESKLQDLQKNSVEKIFKDQNATISAIESDHQGLYVGENGETTLIKVLATRGDSFVRMGHDWCRFILDNELNYDEDIPVEFILGNDQNDNLIRSRYQAFYKNDKSVNNGYNKFKERYQDGMKKVHSAILSNEHCVLYLHDQERLPFRMIFIGKYLYLSSFLNEKKAAETPVMRIRAGSSLYQVCEEYYEWIKAISIPHPEMLQRKTKEAKLP